MTPNQLKEVLRLHKLWLNGDSKGTRASLIGVNIEGANLIQKLLTIGPRFQINLIM